MLELIKQPWPWYTSGIVIAFVMTILLFFGKSFGFSSNFRIICAACGAAKAKFFDFNWKAQAWNLLFLGGAVIGGFIATEYLSTGEAVQISAATIRDLKMLGIGTPAGLQPNELFGTEALYSLKGFLILLGGGFMIGFGSRYAGGCTSGHAISGLSNLQLPSLIAVIGFFIGGLAMTHLLLPYIL